MEFKNIKGVAPRNYDDYEPGYAGSQRYKYTRKDKMIISMIFRVHKATGKIMKWPPNRRKRPFSFWSRKF